MEIRKCRHERIFYNLKTNKKNHMCSIRPRCVITNMKTSLRYKMKRKIKCSVYIIKRRKYIINKVIAKSSIANMSNIILDMLYYHYDVLNFDYYDYVRHSLLSYLLTYMFFMIYDAYTLYNICDNEEECEVD